MITNEGRNIIKRVFAGQAAQIAGSMAFGTGTTAANLTDVSLDEEVIKVAITSIGADLANNRIVFKASIQPGTVATINEVGLYSSNLLITGDGPLDGSNVLVARTVLSAPVSVDQDVVSEVEYSLEINIT